MTAFKQDFFTYPGDASQPIFTVVNGNGVPINIASVSEIHWDARQKLSLPPAIIKLKSTGGVVLVGGGTTGQLQVILASSDTTPLFGVYLHQVVITDSLGNVSTVSLGQLTVGRAPSWTYDPTQLGTIPGTGNPLMQVRREIGDTNYSDQQIWDDEIMFALGQRGYISGQPSSGVIYGAAADCCRFIAANYARQVDTVQGELKTNYSQRTKSYLIMATKFDLQASVVGLGTVYCGGISVSDKLQQEQNSDRPPTAFTKGMTDNLRIAGNDGPETPPFGGENNRFGMLPDF